MFSPSSGSLNSEAPDTARGARAGGADGGAAFGVGDAAGSSCTTGADAFGGGACAGGACDFAPAPFSTVKITCPTLSLSPSLTRISLTTPLTDDGTSMTALS